MRSIVVPAALAAAVLLSSCATPYGSSGFTGGYTEKKISDSAYVVSFSGNGFASRDRVYYFWMYRCAEVTLQQGYALFAIRANTQKAALEAAPSLRPAVYRDQDRGSLVRTGGGYTAPIIIPGGGGGATKWTYSATILMYRSPLPPEVLWAIDAQHIIDSLKPYVTSNGSATPPTRDDLLRLAFVAHARITVGSGASASAQMPTDPAAPAHPPRSAAEVAQGFEERRLVDLQQLFQDYTTRSGKRAPMEVVLDFDVTPNGQVSGCHVSAPGSDPAFGTAVESLVRQTEFAARDAAPTAVRNFHILFAPL